MHRPTIRLPRLTAPLDAGDRRLVLGILLLSLGLLWTALVLGVAVFVFLHVAGMR